VVSIIVRNMRRGNLSLCGMSIMHAIAGAVPETAAWR
jgi:hypothetical protein